MKSDNMVGNLDKPRSRMNNDAAADCLTGRIDTITEKLNAIYATESSTPDPALEAMQYGSMDDERW